MIFKSFIRYYLLLYWDTGKSACSGDILKQIIKSYNISVWLDKYLIVLDDPHVCNGAIHRTATIHKAALIKEEPLTFQK